MKSVRAAAIVILVGIGVALMGMPDDAQQPTAVSTPAPLNPNWCFDVPASPPPPGLTAEIWANERQTCMNGRGIGGDSTCRGICLGAKDSWWRARIKAQGHPAEQPPQSPNSTDKLQGPFRLKGGGWKFILPRAPAEWTSLARGLGVASVRVETAEALIRELERSLATPGPSLIEMIL